MEPAPSHGLEGRCLCAYGTLMTAATGAMGTAQRARLNREAASLGPATTEGRLFDLGRYPGLVLPGTPATVVHGEMFALTDPGRSLRWLDAYEGIVPGKPGSGEYVRMERPVDLADGRRLTAFVYVYQRDVSNARLVPDGRWLNRSA